MRRTAARPICHSVTYAILFAWDKESIARGRGMRSKKDAMPMHRTIGMSLACLLTSACAIGKTLENSTSHYPGDATGVPRGNAEMPTGKSRDFHCGAAQKRRLLT
jgi:hypothetical protein